MIVDSQSALRGVRSRLIGAVVAATITLVCLLYAMLSSLNSFGSTFALTVGICSFGAAVALLLSARHEEEVHELASEFNEPYASNNSMIEEWSGRTLGTQAPPLKALPEPHPLQGADLVDRSELRGVTRRDYSAKTDGVI